MPEILYKPMIYIRLHTTNPYCNLAVEEYLLRHSDEDVFMLWQNEPSVILGKNQNAYAEVNLAYARERGIHVVRRITGGGAVYHDAGNLNYTFITGNDKAAILDYAYFAAPILSALSKLGLDCRLSGRNDLECNGRKFSGNAQAQVGERILHHGTLLFDANTAEMSAVLRRDEEKLAHKGVRSHASRVVNLRELLDDNFTVEDFISHIEREVLAETGATRVDAPVGAEIDALYARNASEEWIFSDRRYLTEYEVSKKKKFPFGVVCVSLRVVRNEITEALISGDFFGQKPIEELEELLRGRRVDEPLGIDPSPYISGMTEEELASLLRS